MKLTIVGCAGSFPRADAACSAYLLEADGFRLLLDMGNGALGALQRHIGLFDLDALLVSHLHGDHCFDACTYVVARRYCQEAPLPTIPLYAPAGTLDRFSRAYEVQPGNAKLEDVYEERALAPGALDIGPFRLTVDRMNHPVETFGVRVEHDGSTLAYSADSGPTAALEGLARGVDVFLCEATFSDLQANPPDLHLTGGEAGRFATLAGVGQLLLTHLTTWSDPRLTHEAAAGAYDGPTRIVASGETYDI